MSDCSPPYEGDPKDSGFKSIDFRPVLGCVGDSEIIASLVRAGVDYPTIFSLVWGWRMGYHKARFTEELTKTVLSIEKHLKKKEEAFDIQEQKLHGVILELLQIMYEKQVNDIVKTTLGD